MKVFIYRVRAAELYQLLIRVLAVAFTIELALVLAFPALGVAWVFAVPAVICAVLWAFEIVARGRKA